MKKSLYYLTKLEKNNNRDWFQANKEEYTESHEEVVAFAEKLMDEMSSHDNIELVSGKKSIFRIYRDVRFSKDKTPYKSHWAGFVKRASAQLRGGYYYHINPKGSYVMGGFFGPNAQDLLHIRKQLSQDGDLLREVIESKNFKDFFGELLGDQLKTCPKGFENDDPNIDLLRYKQFMVRHDFSDKQVLDPNFHKIVSDSFKEMRPFFDVMSELLTTDLNGIPIV